MACNICGDGRRCSNAGGGLLFWALFPWLCAEASLMRAGGPNAAIENAMRRSVAGSGTGAALTLSLPRMPKSSPTPTNEDPPTIAERV